MTSKSIPLLLIIAGCFGLTVQAQRGLLGEYFNGRNFEQKVLTRTDAQINFVWDNVAPAAGIDPYVFSVRWTGKIKSPESGSFLFRAHVDDGIRLWVDDKLVIDAWDLHDSERVSGTINLTAGREYKLRVEYFNALREGEIQVYWQFPSETPVFQGLLGYNDHLIDSRYFSHQPPPPSIVATPKPVQMPPKKPVTKPAIPASKPAVKPAMIARDTLEKYLPKNILFEKSKSIMLPESEPELDRLAAFLLRNPKYRLAIHGHTDHIGNAAKNMILSEERAQKVAGYLILKGVAAHRITAKGYGDTLPLVRETSGVANAKNRRVTFTIQE